MDDLRTDLKHYFDFAIQPVEIGEIVETGYVIGAGLNSARGRRGGWEWLGAAAGVIVVLLVWGIGVLTDESPPEGGDAAIRRPATEPTIASTRPESPIRRATDPFDFTFTAPMLGSGWERFEGFRLQKSARGPQGAEGIVYWVSYPNSQNATNCVLNSELYSMDALDNLARGVINTPGLTLLSGPENVLVGGRSARYSTLEITADDGCDPGYFYNWTANDGGALWYKYSVGQLVDVWVVDVDDQPNSFLVVVGLTHPEYPTLRDEIDEFVTSIVFPTG